MAGVVRCGLPRCRPPGPAPLAENGRCLFFVAGLADRWDVLGRKPVGKTVVAGPDLPR
ncbi:hypothetical protein ACFYXM_05600 [Streptomyces sp. NPDC002476]|uniref:hypothetical protein n=1 Tax=Streptomyces sp. NPDC002476 TaxID=3364648 RepID=UPI0036BA76F6